MTRVNITALASEDTRTILTDLARESGFPVAERFSRQFDQLYVRLLDHPQSCQLRPQLGQNIRGGVVAPYIVIYRFDVHTDTVDVIRILHGSRKITRNLLRDD